ncbi:MAG: hypothetical protein K2W92_03855, partial [Alphaproteobacteria bacterium]|nr:hypothetical protein [Alphaproteobacteria bacterium]
MKKIFTLLSCVFLFEEGHACLHEDQYDYVRIKQALRRHFNERGDYDYNLPKGAQVDVEQDLRRVLAMSSEMGLEDDEVHYNLASFLISRGGWDNKLEGLGLVARLALRQEFLQGNSVYLFMDTLTTLHQSSPIPWGGDSFSLFTPISDFFNKNTLTHKKTVLRPLNDAISRFLKVFTTCPQSIREHSAFSSILDASVQSIINFLGVKKMQGGQVILHQNYLSKTDKQGLIFRHIGEVLKKENLLKTPYTKGLYASSLMTFG